MFFHARIKLTALYVLIVALIVCGFSLFLYQSIRTNLQDADQENFTDSQHQQVFIEHTLDGTQNNIILADIIIIVFAAGLSYVLAGRTLKPIQLSLEAQRAFAANASHELRTPLAVMKNDIEVLQRSKHHISDEETATLHSNLEEIARMSGIVEDLLLLARSDNQKIPEFSRIDISLLLQSVARKLSPLAESKGVTFAYTPIGPLFVNGSAHHLERVALNIIQNSLDHTPKGGSITIITTGDAKIAHVQFIDTGVGIDAHDLPQVFTRFHKGETSAGTGLGLSIVKEIVEEHKGSVSIDSARGKGTTISVSIPLI